jgi:hypothetical protein
VRHQWRSHEIADARHPAGWHRATPAAQKEAPAADGPTLMLCQGLRPRASTPTSLPVRTISTTVGAATRRPSAGSPKSSLTLVSSGPSEWPRCVGTARLERTPDASRRHCRSRVNSTLSRSDPCGVGDRNQYSRSSKSAATTPAGDRLDVAGAVDSAQAFPATLSGSGDRRLTARARMSTAIDAQTFRRRRRRRRRPPPSSRTGRLRWTARAILRSGVV